MASLQWGIFNVSDELRVGQLKFVVLPSESFIIILACGWFFRTMWRHLDATVQCARSVRLLHQPLLSRGGLFRRGGTQSEFVGMAAENGDQKVLAWSLVQFERYGRKFDFFIFFVFGVYEGTENKYNIWYCYIWYLPSWKLISLSSKKPNFLFHWFRGGGVQLEKVRRRLIFENLEGFNSLNAISARKEYICCYQQAQEHLKTNFFLNLKNFSAFIVLTSLKPWCQRKFLEHFYELLVFIYFILVLKLVI